MSEVRYKDAGTLVRGLAQDYGTDLVRFIARRVRNEADARDLAQEAYVRLLRMKRQDLIRDPRPYLYRVAANVLYEFELRREADVAGLARWSQEQQLSASTDHQQLTRSPAHITEFLAVSSAWGALTVPAEGRFTTAALIAAARESQNADNVIQWSDRGASRALPVESRRTWTSWLPSRSRAAAAAACLIVGVLVWTQFRPHAEMDFATTVGEQRSVTLRDGSVMFLNTDSKVRVRWSRSERHVDLLQGEARFRVASNADLPFVVTTTRAVIRVLGTTFNVRAETQSTQVAVMEGQVEVLAMSGTPTATGSARRLQGDPALNTADGGLAAPSIRLTAGERVAVTTVGVVPDTGPSIESVAAWTERRLVFRDQSLGVVVSEFNRYRVQPLVVDDPHLAALKISGAFDLNDPQSLVVYLQTFETVRVDRSSDGSEHLSRR